ncbi:MAG: metal-dependent hydrolase [Palaeococcus sp.]|uniref:metal-dependent hydrolase n=1 Tax=Palaeococcus sp. (in: euryarchaeotes) TaxID=2820298 RepID=UPI0025EFA98A|nr:metal-dependent hydrolase [Palaeococcus sp. (in: euryarchaeotes)]MCD6559078.1 metal-dependent hydrolase [Palaeococcus sp. (in: euryarchaeotes)]
MNYEGHVLGGILTYPLAVLFLALLRYYANFPVKLSFIAMALGYAFYVLGSDLPDLDHPDALIHRGSKPIVAVLVGSAFFVKLIPYINFTSYGWANLTIGWGISALVAFCSWHAYTALMPKHRGVVHSLTFAAIYGILIFIALYYGVEISFEESLFVGIVASMGYVLHLLSDRDVKLI